MRVDIPNSEIHTIVESDETPTETVRRALALYRILDNADEFLAEKSLLEEPQEAEFEVPSQLGRGVEYDD